MAKILVARKYDFDAELLRCGNLYCAVILEQPIHGLEFEVRLNTGEDYEGNILCCEKRGKRLMRRNAVIEVED